MSTSVCYSMFPFRGNGHLPIATLFVGMVA